MTACCKVWWRGLVFSGRDPTNRKAEARYQMPVTFRPELDPLRPYVPPKSWRMAAEGKDDNAYAKLTSNELAFGPLREA